jgi:hypothetical protein
LVVILRKEPCSGEEPTPASPEVACTLDRRRVTISTRNAATATAPLTTRRTGVRLGDVAATTPPIAMKRSITLVFIADLS